MVDRVAFYLLLIVAAVAFQAYRAGHLGGWLKAKFWNTAEAAPPSGSWGGILAGAQAGAGAAPPAPPALGVAIGDIVDAAGIQVHRSIAPRVTAMVQAAARAGITLRGTGWRSTAEQARLREVNGCPDIDISPASACRVPTARPGESMHERGLAIDFQGAGDRTTAVYQWLASHARGYGLFNLPSEPWHWSTNGR